MNPNTSKRKVQKSERQKAAEEAAKWQAANHPKKTGKKSEDEPSRVGDRPYARGRAYVPGRFDPNYQIPAEEAEPEIVSAEEAAPEADGITAGEIGSDSENGGNDGE